MWNPAATLTDLVLPRPCPGCGGPEPWCTGCAAVLDSRPREPQLADAVLDRFAALAQDYGCGLPHVRSLARYAGPIRAAIIAGKERGRRDLPGRLGEALASALLRLQAVALVGRPLWLVPAPSRPVSSRARGGDPVTAMARGAAHRVAHRSGQPVGMAACLRTRTAARDSVGLTAGQRLTNLTGRVLVDRAALPPPDGCLVLVDDVLTTGATAVASCAALAACDRRVAAVLTVAAAAPWRTSRQ